MISSRLFKAFQQRGLLAATQASQPSALFQHPARYFSKDNNDDAADAAPAEEVEAAQEPEPVPAPKPKAKAAPKQAASAASNDALNLDRSLFQAFDLGNIKEITSTPDHKPPSEEDTIEGRYSGVLFTTASQNEALYHVYSDMKFLQGIYKNSEMFRLFTENGGVGSKEMAQLNVALKETAPFHDVTLRFLTVLAENKRLGQIDSIATKYSKLYQEFNKEEKITIISATDLSADQKSQVVAALQANPQNEGKQFTIDYEIDETIMGGLQMYTESEFMDMSLSSRLDRIQSECEKLGN